jgi:hypothetical protein
MFGLSKRPPRKIVFRWYLIVTRELYSTSTAHHAKHVPAFEIELIRAVSRSCSAITDRPAALTVRQVRTSQASTSKTWSRVDPNREDQGPFLALPHREFQQGPLLQQIGLALRWQRFLVSLHRTLWLNA